MRLPAIQGLIDRRILVNYRVDAEVAARLLPSPFRTKLVKGYSIAGICLIRLNKIRPVCLPIPTGLSSENAAHRFAVVWDRDGREQEGVFITRRDSNSCLNFFAGGRLFPGEHYHATFETKETDHRLSVRLESDDALSQMSVTCRIADALPAGSVFSSLDEASRFFEGGALGYSATHDKSRYDGLELRCKSWSVQPLAVEAVRSSFFDDMTKFPLGSAVLDCALLMRNVEHEWHTREDICCTQPVEA